MLKKDDLYAIAEANSDFDFEDEYLEYDSYFNSGTYFSLSDVLISSDEIEDYIDSFFYDDLIKVQ